MVLCPCHLFLIDVYFMSNEICPSEILGPSEATHIVVCSVLRLWYNETLISQAKAITRFVSQFGFKMNYGNEL